MGVDVTTKLLIERPREEVAAYAADPDNAPKWQENIKQVAWRTERPLAVGSRVEFVAEFLGRRLEYTYDVAEWKPGARLVMRTSEGPFPMETVYEWEAVKPDVTRMTLRNRGEPSGFSRLFAPLMIPAMKRASAKDLRRLKQILEVGALAPDRQEI